MMGRFSEAEDDVIRTLELEPRHFGALSGLGLVYLQLDQLGMAKQAFEDLLDVHPNSPNARENLKKVDQDLRLNVI